MILGIKKPFFGILLASIVIAGTLIVLRYTGYCRLSEVIPATDMKNTDLEVFGPFMDRNLFDVPLADAASSLLTNDRVFRVDFDYRLPSKIEIKINQIEPIALIVTDKKQEFFQLDRNKNLIPIVSPDPNLTVPLVIGVKRDELKKKSVRQCLAVLTDELIRIKKDFTDFYLALASIEITSPYCVTVHIDGLSFGLKTYVGMLHRSLRRLKLFLIDYNPELEQIRFLDLRSENQIVAVS